MELDAKTKQKHGKPLDKANIIITQTPRNTSKNHPDFEIAKPDPSAFETSGLKPKSLLNTAQKLAVPNTPVKKSPLIDTGNTFSSASRVADSSILEFSTLNYRNSTTGHTSFLFSPSLNKTPVHDKFYNSTGILDDSPLQLSKGQKATIRILNKIMLGHCTQNLIRRIPLTKVHTKDKKI